MSCDQINDILSGAAGWAQETQQVIAGLRAELAEANARIASLTET